MLSHLPALLSLLLSGATVGHAGVTDQVRDPEGAGPSALFGGSEAPGASDGPPDLKDAASVNRCSFPGERGGRVDLLLRSEPWRGWEALCGSLGDYLRPGRPPWEQGSTEVMARLLVATGYFAKADCTLGVGGVSMTCMLEPARIVYEVGFGGEVPAAVLAEDLRRRVFLRPGTLLGEDERESLERQRRRLEDFLRREGYFGSVVRIRPTVTDRARPNEGVRLDAQVLPGRTVTLRNVEVHGEHPLKREEIVARLTHNWLFFWLPVRFRPIQLEEDIEDITRLLHERGYPEARVTGDWRLDLPNEAVDVILRIEAGPRLIVDFEGNRRLRSRLLRELVTFEEAGIVDPFEMEETAAEIRARYQEVGHDDCAVTVRYEEPGDGTLGITFVIDEGPRRHVSRVSFSGNECFSDRHLLDRVQLSIRPRGLLGGGRWVDAWAEVDRRAIQAYYREQGHAAAIVTVEKRVLSDDTLEAHFTIMEGARRTVGALHIEGLPEEIDQGALEGRLLLVEGAPFVAEHVPQDHRELLATLASHGYTRGDLRREVEAPGPEKGGSVAIRYLVTAGPKSRLGGVLVRGNFRTRTRLIEDQLGLSAGDDLDLVALGRARRRLRSLGPFASVDLVPLDDWRGYERTWLLVEVQERDARTLDGVFSFSTDDRFTLGADYRDHNLFGRAIRLDLRLRLGRLFGDLHRSLAFIGNTDSFDGQLRAPTPLGLPFDVEGSTNYVHEDKPHYGQEYVSIGAGALRDFGRRRDCEWCPSVMGSFRYEVVAGVFEERLEEELHDAEDLVGARANVGRLVPGISFDKKDAFVDPTQGYAGDMRLELAHSALAPIGEGATFVRVLGSTQVYLRAGTPLRRRLRGDKYLGGPVVLAGSAGFGGAMPFGDSDRLPEQETFVYGGDYSVRGLRSRASRPGAAFMFVGNLEARWYLLEGFGFGTLQLAAFADLGTVSPSMTELFSEVTLTAGPALRYVTPVGPISLSWGIPVSVPDRIAEDMSDVARRWGKLHLTFGYAF